jgi:hypothetical protein
MIILRYRLGLDNANEKLSMKSSLYWGQEDEVFIAQAPESSLGNPKPLLFFCVTVIFPPEIGA